MVKVPKNYVQNPANMYLAKYSKVWYSLNKGQQNLLYVGSVGMYWCVCVIGDGFMRITKEMVRELNAELKKSGCAFKYEIVKEVLANTVIERVPMSKKYISSSIINCTDEFYAYLNAFFRKKGIEKLEYNNTGDRCWSADGFKNA